MMRHDHNRVARAERSLAMAAAARDTVSMAKTLDHLPAGKRRELDYVVEILTEEFQKEISTRWSKHLNQGKILKIILYGSFARGDWVDDPVGRYFSDYDLLIVVNKEKLTDIVEFWEGAEKRLLDELACGQRLRTPVSFIVHSLDDVNDRLSKGRYFFIDIVRDGVSLLDVEGSDFVTPQALSSEAALAEAEQYYAEWFAAAGHFLRQSQHAVADNAPKIAAFDLHQAAEYFYNCILLVLSNYSPKSHSLVRLRALAEPLDLRLRSVWPTDTKFQKRCFELLRAAYVKARYSPQFQISAEELVWLQERLEFLKEAVQAVCEARIEALKSGAK